MKQCNVCKEIKDYSNFSFKKDSKDGYRNSCRVCRNIEAKEWYQNNKERKAETTKAWYLANKEKKDAYNNNWWQQNLEKRFKKYKRFHKNNPHKVAEYNATRRASKLKAQPSWLTDDHKFFIEEIYELRKLRSEATNVEHHVDHIVPLRGQNCCGLHVPWNLQVITATENLSKSNQL